LAPDIVRIFFARGAFTEADVGVTTLAVRGIAMGLWATVLAWILIRILNNTGRNTAAIRILCTAYAINALVDVAALASPPGYGLLVIGLGEAIRGIFLLVAIAVCIGWLKELLLVLLRALPVTAAIGFALLQMATHVPHVGGRLVLGIAIGAAGSAALLWLLDREEFKSLCGAAIGRWRLLWSKREDQHT
jgi:putative peptidoglycan lipid II flippase